MTKDPVCGLLVDNHQAAAKAEYQGTIYYFCSPGCHKSFNADPRKYLKPISKQASGDAEQVP